VVCVESVFTVHFVYSDLLVSDLSCRYWSARCRIMDKVTYFPLSCVFGLVASALVAYSKVFKLQKWFSQNFLWVFWN